MALTIKGSAFYFGDPAESPRVTLPGFFTWISGIGNDVQWPFIPREESGDVTRRLFCGHNKTHFYGVFLSARNSEYQHFVKRDGNKVIVEAKATGGNPPVEMNFFAVRLDSGKGIFSHYLGSYRFLQFLHDLWSSYRHFVDITKQQHLANLTEHEIKEDVAKLYSLRGKCNHSPLFTPGSFDNLCGRLQTIFEVRATSYEVDSPKDRPVSNLLTSVHRVYRLNEVTPDESFLSWLKGLRRRTARKLASGKVTHSGSVYGNDSDGTPLSINFENTLEDYLEYKYDDIGTFEIGSLASHALIQEIIEKTTESLLFAPTQRPK